MIWRAFGVVLMMLLHVVDRLHVRAQEHAPCFNCELYNLRQREEAMQGDHPRNKACDPCQCAVVEINCQDGVTKVKDGCGCCLMCARQQGDICTAKDVCDKDKGLYCDMKKRRGVTPHHGFCRARSPKPCLVDGKEYKDGQKFDIGCSLACTCQNGRYGCTSKCPHEATKPSSAFCPNPKLVQVGDRCCREWACPLPEITDGPNVFSTATSPSPDRECKIEVSNWSSCSVSCGMGVSIRITNNNPDCDPREDIRLCMIRPCDLNDKPKKGEKCRATYRSPMKEHIHLDGCKSAKLYNLKYCGTCRHNKCCIPEKTKTKTLTFLCNNGTQPLKNYMWIKSCSCHLPGKCNLERL